jgi:hypothetical protein
MSAVGGVALSDDMSASLMYVLKSATAFLNLPLAWDNLSAK